MYPNNPSLMEKSVWNKADEMQREAQNATRYPSQSRSKSKILVITSLLMALGWLFSLMF